MKLILNDKEIIYYLASLIDHSSRVVHLDTDDRKIAEAIMWSIERKDKLDKFRQKIKDKIYHAVKDSTKDYVNRVTTILAHWQQADVETLKKTIDHVLEKLGEDLVLTQYMRSDKDGFCKSPGLLIDADAKPVRRKNHCDIQEDCILRNTVGNENFLTDKIDQRLPFWFIDSGYTNFIESNKKWHRLVRNHLHFGGTFAAPVDRLHMFASFPQQWRTGGDRILVIEPGQFAAAIFHVDIPTWRYQVEAELRQHTDKKIVFRSKTAKKTRAPLFKHLQDEDYHCVVSINSNAATESIWAGIPVITLDQHMTNSVSRNKLSEVNDLYTGSLANWLAMLSYSQFTYDELVDGTAVDMVTKYHV